MIKIYTVFRHERETKSQTDLTKITQDNLIDINERFDENFPKISKQSIHLKKPNDLKLFRKNAFHRRSIDFNQSINEIIETDMILKSLSRNPSLKSDNLFSAALETPVLEKPELSGSDISLYDNTNNCNIKNNNSLYKRTTFL